MGSEHFTKRYPMASIALVKESTVKKKSTAVSLNPLTAHQSQKFFGNAEIPFLHTLTF